MLSNAGLNTHSNRTAKVELKEDDKEIMNVFSKWKNDVGANKLTYSYINDVLLAPPDELPQAQGQIEQIAEDFGGTITDYTNYQVATHWFSDLEDLASTFSNYLNDINNEWDAGFSTKIIVYETWQKYRKTL